MSSKDLAIGVLSTTAVILFVGFVLVNSQPTPAYGSGMGDRGGDYIVLTGAMWEQEELLYVLDTATNKMMVYRYDMNKNQIIAIGPADLNTWLAGQPAKRPPRGARRGRRNRP